MCRETLQNCLKLAGRTETSIWTNPDERARNETLISVPWRRNNAMLWWFTYKEVSLFSLTRCGCTEHMNSSNSFYNDEVLEKAQNGAHGNVRWNFMPQTKIWPTIHNWLFSLFLSFLKLIQISNPKWAFSTFFAFIYYLEKYKRALHKLLICLLFFVLAHQPRISQVRTDSWKLNTFFFFVQRYIATLSRQWDVLKLPALPVSTFNLYANSSYSGILQKCSNRVRSR